MQETEAIMVLTDMLGRYIDWKKRTISGDDALMEAYEAMKEYKHEAGVTTRQIDVLGYIARNHGTVIAGTEPNVNDALRAGIRALTQRRLDK